MLGAQSLTEPTTPTTSVDSPAAIQEAVPAAINPVPIDAEVVDTSTRTDARYQSLDPRHITVEQIAGGVFAICATGFVAIGFGIWLLASWPPSFYFWLGLGAGLLVLSLLFWAAFGLPRVEHRHASWRLDESGLEIRRGIFWRREITIPRARVQHTDVRQGPLQRQYGIAKLVVHTAGTEAASIELNGLAVPTAEWLRDALINEVQGKHDAV